MAMPARADKPSYVPLWIDKTRDVRPADLEAALHAIESQSPHPQHIVIFVHGWNDTRKESAERYEILARRTQEAFRAVNQQVVVVGLQWPSAVGRPLGFVPQYILHHVVSVVGLGKAIPDPYGDKIVLGRRIGMLGARRFLLAVRDRFPESSVHVFSHSMSAILIESAIRPRAAFVHDRSPACEEQRPLGLDLVCLAGPDMDADAFYRDPGLADDLVNQPRLTWITIPGIFGERGGGGLRYHHVARFKAAMGNAPPRLTDHEWATLVAGGRFLYDAELTPEQHDLMTDYSPRLLRRLAAAAADMRNGTHESVDLTELQAVVTAPDDTRELSHWLDSPRLASRLVALWRTETLLEGKATHLESGYLFRFARTCETNPQGSSKQIAGSRCKLVRDQHFPTSAQWARAWANAGLRPPSSDRATEDTVD